MPELVFRLLTAALLAFFAQALSQEISPEQPPKTVVIVSSLSQLCLQGNGPFTPVTLAPCQNDKPSNQQWVQVQVDSSNVFISGDDNYLDLNSITRDIVLTPVGSPPSGPTTTQVWKPCSGRIINVGANLCLQDNNDTTLSLQACGSDLEACENSADPQACVNKFNSQEFLLG